MTLISEEICGNCTWHISDSDGTIGCMNPESPNLMEDVKWDQSCDAWEVWEDDQNG